MSPLVFNGALCVCTFGATTCPLTVLPSDDKPLRGAPMASIMDHKPMLNLMGFGMCRSPANPRVVAASAKASGELVPVPCIPETKTPWKPGIPSILVDGQPALSIKCTLDCAWAGRIKIHSPGPLFHLG